MRLAALVERFPRLSGALFGVLVALPALLVFRGFTVDDALVSARVASHLAAGQGYRFNPGGPVVDAVTPLGWAHLLALGGPGSPLAMLERGRIIGCLGWLASAAFLGGLLAGGAPAGRRTALVLLAVCTPPAVWASSGMETGLVTLLATLGLGAGPWGALAGGLAAGLRPELAPFAIVLGVGGAWLEPAAPKQRVGRILARLALSVGPTLAVALVRLAWFGSPSPLALSAKPPDLWPGVSYALSAVLLTGPPLVLFAPLSLRKAPPTTLRFAAAVFAHALALALAGGDWMAFFRLEVPVLPAALLAAAELHPVVKRPWHGARLALAVAVSLFVMRDAWRARGVLADRLETIANLRPELEGARVVAAVDVGLVGASTDRTVFDLAGITDPTVARLSGGHTTKRVPEGLVESRGVDRAVLLLAPGARAADPWQSSRFAHGVAARLASMSTFEAFELVGEVPVGKSAYRYLVVSRSTSSTRR